MKRVSSLVLALALIGLASPASAHSAVVYSNPGPNQNIDSGAQYVKLSFSLPILQLGDEFQAGLQILDPNGKKLKPSCSRLTATSMEGVFDFQTPGNYQLTWRVVANDGHIVSSAYRFNVNESNQVHNKASMLCEDSNLGSSTNPLLTSSGNQFTEAISSTSLTQLIWIFGIGALLILVVWFGLRVVRGRGKNEHETEEIP